MNDKEVSMGWRPDGWKNPIGDFIQPHGDGQRWAFELGADAMLTALRKNQWCPYDMSVLNANFKGKVVIIPEENR